MGRQRCRIGGSNAHGGCHRDLFPSSDASPRCNSRMILAPAKRMPARRVSLRNQSSEIRKPFDLRSGETLPMPAQGQRRLRNHAEAGQTHPDPRLRKLTRGEACERRQQTNDAKRTLRLAAPFVGNLSKARPRQRSGLFFVGASSYKSTLPKNSELFEWLKKHLSVAAPGQRPTSAH